MTTIAETPSTATQIYLPVNRRKYTACWNISHNLQACNRPRGHTGRHAFYWRHLDGRVREVWS